MRKRASIACTAASTTPTLKAIEDEAILDVLKMQRDAGIEIYSDGEFRRAFWLSAISDKFFHGFEDRGIDYSRYPTACRQGHRRTAMEFVPQVPVVVDQLQGQRHGSPATRSSS